MAINFEQEIIEALKNPVTARQGIGNVLNKVQAELSGFEASKTNLRNAFNSRSGFENFQISGMDIGNGYKATYEDREIQPGSGTKYGFYQLRNSKGDIIGETSDRTGFLNSVNNYISKDLGYGDLFRPNEGGYSRLSRIVAQYAPKAGVAYRSMEELKQAAKAGRDSVKGNYGTFINAQGKQVIADSPEQLKNFLILGAKKVSDGTTQLKPEEISMIQAAGYKGKELQASLDAYNKANPKVQGVQQTYDPTTGKTTYADGRVEQSTAPKAGIQDVYSFKNITSADLNDPAKLEALRKFQQSQNNGQGNMSLYNKYTSSVSNIANREASIKDLQTNGLNSSIAKQLGIGTDIALKDWIKREMEILSAQKSSLATAERNFLDAVNSDAIIAGRLSEKMNDVIANGYKPGTTQYDSRLKEYTSFYNQLPDFMKVSNAAPREITTSSIQQPNSIASAGQQQPMGDAIYNINGKLMSAAAAQQAGVNVSGMTPVSGGVVDQVSPVQPIQQQPISATGQAQPQQITQQPAQSFNIPFAPNLNDLQKASINNLIGKGTAFNQNDAANFAYSIGLTDPSRFVGLTGQQALALLPAIQKAPTSITEITADTPRYQLKTITSNIAQTQGTTPATSQFIDATFQALHGRKANAGELSKFANQPSSKVYADILAGVPKVKTGDLNSMVDKISTSDPRLDVASGSGEVISKGGTPGDLLAQYGDKLAQLGFTELDKLLMNFQQGQLADIKGKLPGARQAEDALKGEYEKLKTTNYLEGRAKELFQSGTVQDLFDFLASNRKRLENEITSRDLGLSGIGNQPIASEIILGQKRVLQEQATARIGAITASSEAAMGELDRAIQTSDRVMSAIKEDRKNQIDALENLLDMAREDRISLEDDEKAAIEAEIEIIKDANDRLAAEKDDMRKLVVDNPLVAAAAGVSFTDTYEEALNKILTAAQDPSSEVSMLLKKTSKTGGGRTGGGSGSGSEVRNIDVYVKQIKDENGVISYVPNMELLGALPDKEFSAKLEAATLRAAELTNEELANPTMSEASASDYLLPEKTETMTNKVLGAIDEAAGGWVNAAKNVWSWLND